jgi:hypothetical protein
MVHGCKGRTRRCKGRTRRCAPTADLRCCPVGADLRVCPDVPRTRRPPGRFRKLWKHKTHLPKPFKLFIVPCNIGD